MLFRPISVKLFKTPISGRFYSSVPVFGRWRATRSSRAFPSVVFISATGLTGLVVTYHNRDYVSKAFETEKHRNDGPPGKFEKVAKDKKIHVAQKPTEDREWSSFLPDWSVISERLTDVIVPQWANSLPGFIDKLQAELSAAPGTLAEEMWQEAMDRSIHPEITRDAVVRVSDDLCDEERAFLEKRKLHTRKALAKYLDLDEDEIHPDDVPTIAMCGSGGGLRAMVAGASSYYSTQKSGLFDCVTYTAGVSGSCWLQTLYYSSITGQNFERLLNHLKDRLSIHIAFPPELLKLVTSAPTNKFLLSGAYEKYRGVADADFGIVDVYGVMLGARLLIKKGDLDIDSDNLKLSKQNRYLADGQNPLPIYTAVRHEIPVEETKQAAPQEDIKKKAKQEAWFQWFEFTPFELFCEEFGAGIPTWSVGRQFSLGHSDWREDGLALPEVRVPLLLGVFGSAFCATLSHYYKEVRPLVMGLTGFGGLDDMIGQRDEDLVKVHPIDPAQIPNYALGLRDRLPAQCPESIHNTKSIQLMDAGMSNNLPIYPLLRPGRNVDIVIAFDASADIKQDNWLRVVDGYARQRGIKGWPIGSGWPETGEAVPQKGKEALNDADTVTPSQANTKLREASENQQRNDVAKQVQETRTRDDKVTKKELNNAKKSKTERQEEEQIAMEKGKGVTEKGTDDQDTRKPAAPKTELDYCNIWIGSTEERSTGEEPPQPKLVEEDWQLMTPDAGIAVIYFPFMKNPKVEGVDPQTSDYMSTWNFIYTPEQIDKVVALAKTNFDTGEEKTKMCIRAVYERKKQQRLEREAKHDRKKWWQNV